MCKHENFSAKVSVARLEDSGGFMAEITIHCTECGVPMEFLGLEPGIDTQGAKVSVDGTEARIAISPKGTKPNPLQRMAFSINSFNG
jgi:hypothetical protein